MLSTQRMRGPLISRNFENSKIVHSKSFKYSEEKQYTFC